MSDADVQAAARWMLDQVTESGELYQEEAAYHIHGEYEDLTYSNDNGNLAISKEVLAAFRKISDGVVVWERGSRYWRQREQYDPEGKRQAD